MPPRKKKTEKHVGKKTQRKKATGQSAKGKAKRAQATKRKLLSRLNSRKFRSTHEHTRGVVDWAERLTRELKKTRSKLSVRMVSDAAWLHDIGKLEVNPTHLNSKKRLSTREKQHLQEQHVLKVRALLGEVFPTELKEGVLSHHERYDGRGYPLGLAGADIPFIGRLLKVADEFQTKIEQRIFQKKIRDIPEAWNEMIRGKENSFDPYIVNALGRILRRRRWI